jgi:hypothetical protein
MRRDSRPETVRLLPHTRNRTRCSLVNTYCRGRGRCNRIFSSVETVVWRLCALLNLRPSITPEGGEWGTGKDIVQEILLGDNERG